MYERTELQPTNNNKKGLMEGWHESSALVKLYIVAVRWLASGRGG
jgi:hypothetical protein